MNNTDELRRLIESYSQKMMTDYATISGDTAHMPIDKTPTTSKPIASQTETTQEQTLTDIGQLQVRVTTESQAVPIAGAVVTVSEPSNGQTILIRTIITDSNGLTPLLNLPTKDRRLTLEPNHPNPYAEYNVDVTADGYFHKRFLNIPIYGGVTAVQNVSMIPLPEQGDANDVLEYSESAPQNL